MPMPSFKTLQETGKVFVIAEAGLNHNGSLELAKRLIDIAVDAGADAVKFQKRTVEILATDEVLDAPDTRFPEFGATYRQVRMHLEFGLEAYRELFDHCRKRGILFLCTAFDKIAAGFLDNLGLEGFKLASHSLGNLPLLRYVASLKKPTILSTGMAEWDEIDRAVEIFFTHRTPLALLHCVSVYPTPMEQANLAMIDTLKRRYGLPVGYSGHEIGYQPSLAAVAMGACIVERHITTDCRLTGFDHKLSMEPKPLTGMIQAIRAIERRRAAGQAAGPDAFSDLIGDSGQVGLMRGTGEKSVSEQERITRHKYHVSMVAARPLAKDTLLSEDQIVYRNPGTGIPPKAAANYLGRRLARDVPGGVLITPEMFY